MWVEPVATTKLLGYPHSPLQREFCTEGLLGQHLLGRENTALTVPFLSVQLTHELSAIRLLCLPQPTES